MIVKQQDGQILRAWPSIQVEKIGSSINIKFTQIDFIGTNASVGGTGTVGLNINLVYIDSQTYSFDSTSGKDVNITFRTRYWNAWQQFLDDTCLKAGLTSPANYGIKIQQVNDNVKTVTLWIKNSGTMIYNRAFMDVSVQI
jgi:hypothetical protein